MGGPSGTRYTDGIANEDWYRTSGGDGFHLQIGPEDPTIVYTESQYGRLLRFDTVTGEGKLIQAGPAGGRREVSLELVVARPHLVLRQRIDLLLRQRGVQESRPRRQLPRDQPGCDPGEESLRSAATGQSAAAGRVHVAPGHLGLRQHHHVLGVASETGAPGRGDRRRLDPGDPGRRYELGSGGAPGDGSGDDVREPGLVAVSISKPATTSSWTSSTSRRASSSTASSRRREASSSESFPRGAAVPGSKISKRASTAELGSCPWLGCRTATVFDTTSAPSPSWLTRKKPSSTRTPCRRSAPSRLACEKKAWTFSPPEPTSGSSRPLV